MTDRDAPCPDSVVLETLITERGRLFGFLLAWVGERETAEDLLQTAVRRALERADGLRDEERVVAWIYRILRNVLAELGVTHEGMPSDGLHDSPGITLNMMLDDIESVRWSDRVATRQATINGVDISNLPEALTWASEIADARSERTARIIRERIGGS